MLSFNQELRSDDRPIVVLACGTPSQPQDTGSPEVDADGLVVTIPINTPVPRGACTVSWRLADAAGETIVGDFTTFRVDADPAPPTTPAPTDGAAGAHHHQPVHLDHARQRRRQQRGRLAERGIQRRRPVAGAAAVDDRDHGPVRRPGADRHRLAGRPGVRRHRALPAGGVAAGPGRDGALPDRLRRQVQRHLVRGGDQPERLARPQGRRLARSRRPAAAGVRARLGLGGDAPRADHRPDHGDVGVGDPRRAR